MITASQLQTYRRLRRVGWLASYALQFTRDDVRVDELESDEWIRFAWEDDLETYSNPQTDEDREMLANGWEAAGCVAETPSRDPLIGWPTGQWEHAASLWGIVGPFDCSDRDYRRSVELDLAREAGLL